MHFDIGDLIRIHDVTGWRQHTKDKVEGMVYRIESLNDQHVVLEGWDYPIYRHRISLIEALPKSSVKHAHVCKKIRDMQSRRQRRGYAF